MEVMMTQTTNVQVFCHICWKDITVQVALVDNVINEEALNTVICQAGWKIMGPEVGQICDVCRNNGGMKDVVDGSVKGVGRF